MRVLGSLKRPRHFPDSEQAEALLRVKRRCRRLCFSPSTPTIYSSSQGEPGKAGERGAPGPVGAVVSISPGPICSAHCNLSPYAQHEVLEAPVISPLGPRNTSLRCFLFLSIGSCWQRWRSWSSGCPWPCCECPGKGQLGRGQEKQEGEFLWAPLLLSLTWTFSSCQGPAGERGEQGPAGSPGFQVLPQTNGMVWGTGETHRLVFNSLLLLSFPHL